MKTRQNPLIIGLFAGLFGLGCGSEQSPERTDQVTEPQTAESPTAPAGREVELSPLPLRIRVASDSMGAMDMSREDRKSVTVDIGDGRSLNVSEESRSIDALKHEISQDAILFPFRAWERQDGSTAVYRFDQEGNARYHGFTMLTISGASYRCKTTGLDGLESVEQVNEALQACGDIQPRG